MRGSAGPEPDRVTTRTARPSATSNRATALPTGPAPTTTWSSRLFSLVVPVISRSFTRRFSFRSLPARSRPRDSGGRLQPRCSAQPVVALHQGQRRPPAPEPPSVAGVAEREHDERQREQQVIVE